MKNIKEVLERLENMIGAEFDENEIIVAFDSEEEVIVNKVEGQETNFEGHGLCDCYNAYENTEESEVFAIYVNDDNKIVDIR